MIFAAYIKFYKLIIAVNTRLLLKGRMDGIAWFSFESLKRLSTKHPEHEFIFIFDRPYDNEFVFSDNVTPVIIGPQARHPFLFVLWFELSIPYILKKYKADLFFSPDGYLSLRSKTPSISVLHDLNFEYYPKDLPFFSRNYYKFFFPRFAKKASRIITVSEHSKKDICKLYNIEASKIDIAYNGVNENYFPITNDDKEKVRNEYTDGKQYYVFVGTLHPRKNLVGLFQGFDIYKRQTKSESKLVIVGNKQYWTNEIKKTYLGMEFKNEVVFLGHLSPEILNKIVSSSVAMMYVSYFEGFGIPIIEAFKAETAVITSNVTSMPEVAGNAALLIDPFNAQDIANAMTKVQSDTSLRNSLIEKGRQRVKLFSWDYTADSIWDSIKKVIPTS